MVAVAARGGCWGGGLGRDGLVDAAWEHCRPLEDTNEHRMYHCPRFREYRSASHTVSMAVEAYRNKEFTESPAFWTRGLVPAQVLGDLPLGDEVRGRTGHEPRPAPGQARQSLDGRFRPLP